MNQGAYFEQMLMLPNVLGEFRTKQTGDRKGKRIIGLPEHITSDIGSVGDFAASAERAFGTILQRTYAVLGARMHYGHPDIMNKQFMMQQGGVSKATKTLNLSEDIFAGMDFTLRGEGRKIRHCEYFHLAKGRDLGFKSVLVFFSKISSGAGEQIVTRQMFRLGNVLPLPELLTFWYAHIGYYFNQYIISLSMPMLMYMWLLVIISDCEANLPSFCYDMMNPKMQRSAWVVGDLLAGWFSVVMLFFIAATILPLFAEIWYERSLKIAVTRIIKQLMTLSPLLFIFQSKLIGFYFMNELRYGGASYCATGRGLPTERIPFLGRCLPGTFEMDKKKIGGLYLDYAKLSYYDGTALLFSAIGILIVGGARDLGPNFQGSLVYMWISVCMTIVSWLFAPFIFNPYQFEAAEFAADVKAWMAFFFTERGQNWVIWWEKDQLKAGQTNRKFLNFLLDIGVLLSAFFLLAWYSAFESKFFSLKYIFHDNASVNFMKWCCFCPPVVLSVAFCVLAILADCLFARAATDDDSEDASDDAVESGSGASTNKGSGAQSCCTCPLPLIAISVASLGVFEAVMTLQPLWLIGWKTTFLAGFILKVSLREMVLLMGENFIRSSWFETVDGERRGSSLLGRIVVTWVRANRLFRDLFVSTLILVCLTPVVMLNALSQALCPGCNLHELLIFRDTGHRRRQEATLVNVARAPSQTSMTQSPSPQAGAQGQFSPQAGWQPARVAPAQPSSAARAPLLRVHG
eukprot:TRINITY_DN71664_c0_g1_i1.p1 TRINITY_DN71664_c0_g1~~TRINITY_DN71664_c0_g1_i1.p1  ORF type:complete len:873 (-),score=164.17 TRINITY_DN71664_c0_g1_i1:85-2316(-)